MALTVTNWRHSITLRLALAFAGLAILVFATLGIYLSRSTDNHMAELDAHELLGKLALARHIGSQADSPAAFAARLSDALVGEHGIIVAVDGPSGAIFRWPDDELAASLAAVSAKVGEEPARLREDGMDYRAVAGSEQTGWNEAVRVVVARNIHHHTDFLEQLQRDFWLAVLAAALLTVVVGMLIVRHSMRPVRAIAHAAGRISAGRLAERMAQQDVPPELAELVAAFNDMLGRLEESFSRLSDFSADLAHELRTPIHSLRMQTEVSLNRLRTADEYRELLASNLEEYDRLTRIIADMLFLAKADHGLIVPHRERLDLHALCERLLEYYGLLAEDITVHLSGARLAAAGDRLMLERAIGNLLVNAIHHTPAGGTVTVSLRDAGGMAVVAVANTGRPIAPDALERIFDRFGKLDQSSEGNGLGLAITRSIVLAHQGRISVSSDAAGTVFSVALPSLNTTAN